MMNSRAVDTEPEVKKGTAADGHATAEVEKESFAEAALKLGGKSDEEARRTGAIDKADDQVEALVRSAVSNRQQPGPPRGVGRADSRSTCSSARRPQTPPHVQKVMDDSLDVVRKHVAGRHVAGRDQERISQDGARRTRRRRLLGPAGRQASTAARARRSRRFAPFLTKMAMIDGTIAGLACVHGCIGAVDPVRTFGNPEQKKRFLPELASGERLSAFALTEPDAGSDLTALRTDGRARRRRLRHQRRKAVHHQRRARPHDRPGLPDRQEAGRADRRSARPGERTLPASSVRAVRAASTRTTRASSSTTSACRRRTC